MRERLMILVTVVTVAVLTFSMTGKRPVEANSDALPVLRGSALEIVDSQGRVRASIGVLPADKNANAISVSQCLRG